MVFTFLCTPTVRISIYIVVVVVVVCVSCSCSHLKDTKHFLYCMWFERPLFNLACLLNKIVVWIFFFEMSVKMISKFFLYGINSNGAREQFPSLFTRFSCDFYMPIVCVCVCAIVNSEHLNGIHQHIRHWINLNSQQWIIESITSGDW